MRGALPREGCVASRNLGEAQRALFHYFANMLVVCVEVLVKDEDIVEVDEDVSLRNFDMEDIVHHRLESSRGIRKSKKHNQGFE